MKKKAMNDQIYKKLNKQKAASNKAPEPTTSSWTVNLSCEPMACEQDEFCGIDTKYIRKIVPRIEWMGTPYVDVYSVLDAFDVRCPAVQHAIKKLLMAGQRGVKSRLQDLQEAKSAIERAIQMEERR